MVDNNNNVIQDEYENKRFLEILNRDKKKWTIRRRITIASFISILLFGIYYATVGLYSSLEQIKNISEFNGITITIIGALISIIMAYFGTVYMEDKFKLKKSEDDNAP